MAGQKETDMLEHDEAALKVLYLGGTGTISASCVRLSVASGMHVSVLNRGNNSKQRDLPEAVEWLTGGVADGGAGRPHVRRRRELPLLRRRRRGACRGLLRLEDGAVRAHQLGLRVR